MSSLKTDDAGVDAHWKVHLPGLFSEILVNDSCAILYRPLQCTANIIGQVALRASQINDPVLNKLMCDLTLYEIADPKSPNYDRKKIEEIEIKAANSK